MQLNSITYQILGGMYANISNVYVLRGAHSLVMIDCAETAHDLAIMRENLKKWQLDHLPISHVLLTHKHFGHIGNAFRLQRSKAKIIAGKEDKTAIEQGNIHEIVDYSPFPQRDLYHPCRVDYAVDDQEELLLDSLRIRCITAPGHTDGSIVYHISVDGQEILFTGDIINISAECRSVTLGWEGGIDFNVSRYWNSLQKLSKLPCDQIFPGHGQLCMQKGNVVIQKAKKYALLKFRQPSVDQE